MRIRTNTPLKAIIRSDAGKLGVNNNLACYWWIWKEKVQSSTYWSQGTALKTGLRSLHSGYSNDHAAFYSVEGQSFVRRSINGQRVDMYWQIKAAVTSCFHQAAVVAFFFTTAFPETLRHCLICKTPYIAEDTRYIRSWTFSVFCKSSNSDSNYILDSVPHFSG